MEIVLAMKLTTQKADHLLPHSLGEETYAQDKKMELTDDFTWIIDPIDGTKCADRFPLY